MENQPQRNLLLFLLLSFSVFVNAQKGEWSTAAAIGLAVPVLDGGTGFYVGVNPSYDLSSNFSVEGQLSYLHTNVTSSFLSGEEGKSNAVNALLGGRLYLSSAAKSTRFYLNGLFGVNYLREEQNGVKRDGVSDLGATVGAFVELRKMLIGISLESPGSTILKVGYIF